MSNIIKETKTKYMDQYIRGYEDGYAKAIERIKKNLKERYPKVKLREERLKCPQCKSTKTWESNYLGSYGCDNCGATWP